MLPRVSGEFTLVNDGDLRFTPGGQAVYKVRVVAANRKQIDGKWQSDPQNTLFITAEMWGKPAENAAGSVKKGDLVVIDGAIKTNEWQAEDGSKRSEIILKVSSMGPSLQFREMPHGGQAQQAQQPQQQQAQYPPQGAQGYTQQAYQQQPQQGYQQQPQQQQNPYGQPFPQGVDPNAPAF
jgi:single-strand DNA-binding protein